MTKITPRNVAPLVTPTPVRPCCIDKLEPKPITADQVRNAVDKLEDFRKPPVELKPITAHLSGLIERIKYKKSIEEMTPAELKEEALKVEEQLIESSTGRARDPEAKAEALWKRELIQAELKRRALEDPNLPIDKYEEKLEALSDPALANEVKRLEAAVKDATSGAHTNEQDAAKLKEKLAAARSEQAQRVVDDPKTNLLSYLIAVPKLSDKALTAEQAQVRAEYDATLKQLAEHPEQARELTDKLEAQARKLNVLDREMKKRDLPTAAEAGAAEAATESAPEAPVEPAPPAAPASEPYTVVAGDTVSAIAMRISEQNGGTPDWQTVMADMLELNPLPNPDLILVGQVLQLPVYPAPAAAAA